MADRTSPRLIARLLSTLSTGGGILLAATVVALAWANSPWRGSYEDLTHGVVHDVVNDGLMAVFFLVVGLEIKRELVHGELRDRRHAAVPMLAALGGMAVPALLFAAVTLPTRGSEGWGIPMATDIAFALAALSVLGTRVPAALKLFLLTLAVVDDIGAIAVIAVFYSHSIDFVALGVAGALAVAIAAAPRTWLRLALGAALWYAVYRSGVHATIAGVVLGLLMPVDEAENLEHRLNPVSSFVIVPVFALVNAGVSLSSSALRDAVDSPVTIGIVLGLVVGKVLGITGAAWAACRLRIGELPDGVGWRHVAGVGLVGGIGFTVSLFVAGLAYADEAVLAEAKVGILAASLASTGLGIAWLARS